MISAESRYDSAANIEPVYSITKTATTMVERRPTKHCIAYIISSIWAQKSHADYFADFSWSAVGVRRDDDELSETEAEARAENGHGNGSGSRLAQGAQALEITYTRRARPGQPADVVRLGDVDDDVESRCVAWCPVVSMMGCALISLMGRCARSMFGKGVRF